jgi:hypothetical protein
LYPLEKASDKLKHPRLQPGEFKIVS